MKCSRCDGSGSVGYLAASKWQSIPKPLANQPMIVSAQQARRLLLNFADTDTNLGRSIVLQIVADEVRDTHCPDCGGSGRLVRYTVERVDTCKNSSVSED